MFPPKDFCLEYRNELFSMELFHILFTYHTQDNQQKCFRLSNWFSLWCLGPDMNHLPPVCWCNLRFIFLNESWCVRHGGEEFSIDVYFLPMASFGIRVLSLSASVRQSVRPSVTRFFRAITHYPFEPGSPNLDHRCKRPRLRSLLFWGWLTLTIKVKFNFKIKFYPSFILWVCPRHKSPRIVVRIWTKHAS